VSVHHWSISQLNNYPEVKSYNASKLTMQLEDLLKVTILDTYSKHLIRNRDTFSLGIFYNKGKIMNTTRQSSTVNTSQKSFLQSSHLGENMNTLKCYTTKTCMRGICRVCQPHYITNCLTGNMIYN